MRLIDADALKECFVNTEKDSEMLKKFNNNVMLMIGIQPTIEAQPVVHGYNESDMRITDEFCCSECGLICKEIDRYEYDADADDWHCYEFDFRYCPNCGAKMDGKKVC